MIDLILFAVIVGAFFVGFKAGNKHATLKALAEAIKAKFN